MQPFRTFIGCRAFHAVTRRRWRVAVPVLHGIVVSGCAPQATSEALVFTGPTQPTATAVDSVRAVPLAVAASAAPTRGPITIHLRPVTVDSRRGPPMYVVDGVVLGRRDDGTIDHEAAGRALAKLDPRTITAIQVLKGESAVQRFGTSASDGVVLFDIASRASRAKAGDT